MLARRAGDHPQRRLPVLQTPAGVRAGPARRHQPQVGGDRRGAEREQRGQPGQDARGETPRRHGRGRTGRGRRTSRSRRRAGHSGARAVRCRPARRATTGANDGRRPCAALTARIVSCTSTTVSAASTGSSGGERDLELALRVLGMDLFDRDALRGQRHEDRAQVGRELDEPDHPVRRAGGGRNEVVTGAPGDAPLDLEAGAHREPGRRQPVDLAAQQPAAVQRVRLAGLVEALGRRPGPARRARPAARAGRRSGCSRRSPTGPPAKRPRTDPSSTRKVSNTGATPAPQAAAWGRRASGTALTRVMPLVSTQVSATPSMPSPASRSAASRACAAWRSRSLASTDLG